MPDVLIRAVALGAVLFATGPPPGAAAATPVGPAVTTATAEPCASTPRAFFRDVADTSTAASAIDCLVWHELVRGVSHERFAPNASLTRGQLATLIDQLVSSVSGPLPDPARPRFVDVGGVHAPAVERLAAAGIVTGRTPQRYEPDLAIRRDQLASLLLATFERLTGLDGRAPGGAHGFTDIGGNVHERAIARTAELELVAGTGAGDYQPSRPATRGQTAIVLARLLPRTTGDDEIATKAPPTGYAARVADLPGSLLTQTERWTWEPGCPVPPGDLRLLELVHIDLAGVDRWGLLVVHRDVATDVAAAFGALYDDGFPIARMEPIEHFRGDDDASMAANNTSAFNCRRVTGGTAFSEHAYGRAIDLNPVQNPYVRGGTVLPDAGREHLDRRSDHPGMLVRPGGVTAFDDIGWGWGGDYGSLKDYQHVSSTGG